MTLEERIEALEREIERLKKIIDSNKPVCPSPDKVEDYI